MKTRLLKKIQLLLILSEDRQYAYKFGMAHFLRYTTIVQTYSNGFLVKKYYFLGFYLYKSRFFRREV